MMEKEKRHSNLHNLKGRTSMHETPTSLMHRLQEIKFREIPQISHHIAAERKKKPRILKTNKETPPHFFKHNSIFFF